MSSPEAYHTEAEGDEEIWQEKYKNLHLDFEKLEARVVALAQREYQITDSKITKKYQQIRDGIDIWIDELQEEDRKDFRAIYQSNLQSRDRKQLFTDVGFEAGYLNGRWKEELGKQETCLYVVLGMVIGTFLKGIFREPYPLGSGKSQEHFLDMMMKSSSKTKDQAMLYRWRGETLSMIINTPDFAERRKGDFERVFRKFKNDITPWLSQRSLNKHEAAFREMVLQPAVDFHRMVNCSGKKFDFDDKHIVQSPVPEMAMSCDLVDIASWRTSRSSDIKGIFHCLLPGLVMRLALDQSNVTFVAPVLLGYKTSSLDPGKYSSKSGRSSPVKQDSMTTERGTYGSKGLPGHRSSQLSRASNSKSDSVGSKDNRPESFVGRVIRSTLLLACPESRIEASSTRKSSQPSVSSPPNTRSNLTRHNFPPSSRHSQPSGSGSETSRSSTISTSERVDAKSRTCPVDRDEDYDIECLYTHDSDSGMGVRGRNGTGSVNARPIVTHAIYVDHDDAARLAGRSPWSAEPETYYGNSSS
ncbi:hypothetical protein EG329_001274 [Mollisiaceae sp. DMI_Dod_QoI]|nr:hypothetical protein EG329_001274 [Helotiales sp. DMI_Dod_QoI]